VLQYVLLHSAEPQLQVVRSILEGTLAVMLKRGWMDADDQARAAFFQVRTFAAVNGKHICSSDWDSGHGTVAVLATRLLKFCNGQLSIGPDSMLHCSCADILAL
jgi:hypothetical protein